MHEDEQHDHPAAPEPIERSFAEGIAERPRPADQRREPDFARGIARERDVSPKGRFSQGEEALPDTPEKRREGSFGDGFDDATGHTA